MVGKEHNARLSQPARWHRVWQLRSLSSRCAWQRPPQGLVGYPEVPSVWAASVAPAGLSRRCWACCPPRAGQPPSPSLRGAAASLRLLLESCRCPRAGCRPSVLCWCRAQPRHQAVLVSWGMDRLLHQEWEGDGWSGSSCAVTPNTWQEVFRSAGSSAGLEGRQRQDGRVWVRLQRGSPAAPGSRCRQVCPLPGTLLALLAALSPSACPHLPQQVLQRSS